MIVNASTGGWGRGFNLKRMIRVGLIENTSIEKKEVRKLAMWDTGERVSQAEGMASGKSLSDIFEEEEGSEGGGGRSDYVGAYGSV